MFADFTVIWELCYTVIHAALFPHTIQKISTYSRDRNGWKKKVFWISSIAIVSDKPSSKCTLYSPQHKLHNQQPYWYRLQVHILHSTSWLVLLSTKNATWFDQVWPYWITKNLQSSTFANYVEMWKFSSLYVLKQEASSTSLRSN